MVRTPVVSRIVLLGLLGLMGQCTRHGSPDGSERPNIILISIDTLRRDALGCYGGSDRVSPNIDRLASDALVFDSAIAQAPWTLPSHAAMLTSLYPEELDLGTFGKIKRVDDSAVSIAETLREAGYTTFAHVAGAFLDATTGLNQGFAEYDDRASTMPIVVDRCIERLRRHDGKQPFFAFLHTYDVHKYDPPPQDRASFVTVRPDALATVPAKAVAELLQNNDNQERVRRFGAADRQFVRQLYDAAVHSVDREIGRLLGALEERKLLENTIVVITADHGEEFWEHGRTGHGYNLNDENLRVPLILHLPNGPRGRFTPQVRLIDLPPTITAIVGISRASEWQGVDLVARHAAGEGDLLAFSESAHLPFKSVRLPALKLIVSLRRPYTRWYDLATDPTESASTESSSHRDANRLETSFRSWLAMTTSSQEGRGRAVHVENEAVQRDVSALGYTSGSESVPNGAEPWLRALAGETPPPRTKK